MNTTKHTPGPFDHIIEKYRPYPTGKAVTNGGIEYINPAVPEHLKFCINDGITDRLYSPEVWEKMQEDKVRAAAPELLAALGELLRHCVTPSGFPDKGKGRTDEQQRAYDNARAAIAKATK